MVKIVSFCLVICAAIVSISAKAESDLTLTSLRHRWLLLETQQSKDELIDSYQQLISQADLLSQQYPNIAESRALSGMIKCHFANLVGGLNGLSMAKQAKEELQTALASDPSVFNGVTYAELGALYHKTPNWPFSFGSDKMAEKLFTKALEINPDGLLTNLYFGQYWFEQHKYAQARQYLLAATQASPHNEDPEWFNYQLQLATNLLARVEQKISN